MRKLILILLAAVPMCQASAQLNSNRSFVQLRPASHAEVMKNNRAPTILDNESTIALKTAATAGRWYNHAQQMAAYDAVTSTFYSDALSSFVTLWQDSSVMYPDANGLPTADGITWLSAAEIFAPNTNLYNSNTVSPLNNRGKLRITTESYHIDSVMIRGYYARNYNYNDTLILTFVADSTKGLFAGDGYDQSVATNHGIDSFADVLYDAADYLARPINQVSYYYGSSYLKNAVQKKIVLNQQTFNDSLSDGTHQIKAAVGIDVPGSAAGLG